MRDDNLVMKMPAPPTFSSVEDERRHRKLRLAAGTPTLIDADTAALTAGQVGSHTVGWFSFQPLFARILREQPDLAQ